MKKLIFLIFLVFSLNGYTQLFPNPTTLSTGQGPIGTLDPIWLVSPWYISSPPNPIGLVYTPALININCAPGAWVDPTSLPAPVNNGNWITGNEADCANNALYGYRYFRLTLNLPPDCNGNSVADNGNYILYLSGYVDNGITDVFVNGTSLGINGGNFSVGTQLDMTLPGPWVPGVNYVDIQVFNSPGTSQNPYGLLLVANNAAAANSDLDNDGIPDNIDLCPCEPSFTNNGCPPPITPNTTICQGETTTISIFAVADFLWNTGQTTSSISVSPNTTTSYTCTLTYPNGTQEFLTSIITVNSSYNSTINASICAGEVYSFAANQYTQAGVYTFISQTINGCDSTSILTLTVHPSYNDTLYQTICVGESISFEGTTYSTPGIYNLLLTSIEGCDSLHVLNLTVLPTSSSILAVTECGNYTWNGQNYTESGTFSFLSLNSVGCDSIASLTLIIHPDYNIAIDTAICQGTAFVSNGFSYSQTGNYSILLQTGNGCDSVLLISLTVYPIPMAPQLYSNQPECPGDALELTASGTGSATIYWQGPSEFYSNQSSISLIASNGTMGEYSAYCVENGCFSDVSSISTSISFPNNFNDREFPNILTPNQDFINDDLDLKSIFQSCLSYELRIINRWGNLVYLQKNDSEPFKGNTQSGNKLEEGVYFYQLTYDDGVKSGFFHISR